MKDILEDYGMSMVYVVMCGGFCAVLRYVLTQICV